MSVLLVQLGDIHFESNTDPVMERAKYIGATIASTVKPETTLIVLAICGDAAYSGTGPQFDAAEAFVASLETELNARFNGVSIVKLAIPGNHDCDFSADQAARNALLTTVKESEIPAKSIETIILSPLSAYFSFADRFTDSDKAINSSSPYYRSVDLMDGSSSLRLHLVNTAWMSSRHETPGSLHFPLATITPPGSRADCSIAILHHPTNWFSQPHVMRPLRDKIAEIASFVLVNHEHMPEARLEIPLFDRDTVSKGTVYVCGGVVQETKNKDLSSFVMIELNLTLRLVTLTRHELRLFELLGTRLQRRDILDRPGKFDFQLSVCSADQVLKELLREESFSKKRQQAVFDDPCRFRRT